jgi:hypothetical protein
MRLCGWIQEQPAPAELESVVVNASIVHVNKGKQLGVNEA